MAILITRNGEDITNLLLTYERTQSLCSGIGSLILTVEAKTAAEFESWDEVILEEDGRQVGMYYVSYFDHNLNSANKIINCQDNTKRLSDTYIAEMIPVVANTNAKYWIQYLMNQAGVSCIFTSPGNGSLLNPDSSMGLDNAYNLLLPLLQQSGWYMYINEVGEAVIGDLTININNVDIELNNEDILSVYTNKNDKMLRNRALVIGMTDAATDQQVYADIVTHTPWNYDNNDVRTVVYANSTIPNNGVAYTLANKIIQEFARITYTHTITSPGFYEASLGNVVFVDSDIHSHVGVLTTISVSSGPEGFITTFVLDERCPRLFGYIGSDEEYVYISTLGAGVKRKALDGLTWVDFSAGLLDFNIIDLMIKRGIFSCVSEDGYGYIRTPTTSVWSRYLHPDLVDLDGVVHPAATVEAIACDIDATNYHISFGYRTKEPVNGQYKSWVIELNTHKQIVNTFQLYIGDTTRQDLKHLDTERLGEDLLPVASGPINYILDTDPDLFWGVRDVRQTRHPDTDAFTYGPTPSETPYLDAFVPQNFGGPYNTIYIRGQDLYLYGHFNKYFKHVCMEGDTPEVLATNVNWPNPTEGIPNSSISAWHFWIDPDKSLDPKTNDYHLVLECRTNGGNHIYYSHYRIKPLLSEGDVTCANILASASVATTEQITLSGLFPIDGQNINELSRVLVKNQSDATENGLYYPRDSALWVRADTYTTKSHTIVPVASGTENQHRVFQLKTEGQIIYGQTDLIWEEVLNVVQTVGEMEEVVVIPSKFPDSGVFGTRFDSMHAVDEWIYWTFSGANRPPTTLDYGYSSYVVSYNMKTGELKETVLGVLNLSQFDYPEALSIRCGKGIAYVEVATGKFFQTGGENRVIVHKIENGTQSSVWQDVIEAQYDPNIVAYGRTRGTILIPVGYQKYGDTVRTFVKFRITFKISKKKPECQDACPGVPGWKWDEYQYFAGLDITTNEYTAGPFETTRGEDVFPLPCCTTIIPYDGFDYVEYNFDYGYFSLQDGANYPLTSSAGSPVFIHQGKYIYSSISLQQVGTLDNPANYTYTKQLASTMDDFDNSIYIMDGPNSTLYKEKEFGGTWAVATCSGCPGMNYIGGGHGGVVSNGYYINAETPPAFDTGWEGGYGIYKMNNSIIMSGLYLVYILKNAISGGFTIEDYDFYRLKLEESYDFPLVSHTTPSSVATFVYSGQTFGTTMPEHYRIYDTDFKRFQYNIAVNDVTITDFVGYSGADYGRYLISTPSSGVFMDVVDTILKEQPTQITEISGYFGQVESTNFKTPNYIFTNTSGYSQFYQRQGVSGVFINASINLPEEEITSIRCDDVL